MKTLINQPCWVVAFADQGHLYVSRSPLLPDDDPWLAPVWDYVDKTGAALTSRRTEKSDRFMFGEVVRSEYVVKKPLQGFKTPTDLAAEALTVATYAEVVANGLSDGSDDGRQYRSLAEARRRAVVESSYPLPEEILNGADAEAFERISSDDPEAANA